MNTNRVNGTIDEAVGNAKQKAGELIGDTSLQAQGIAQRAKGKIENAFGKVEDAIDQAKVQSNPPQDPHP